MSFVEKSLKKAKILQKNGDFAEASNLYQNILGRFPANMRAIEGLQELQKATKPTVKPVPEDRKKELQDAVNSGALREAHGMASAILEQYGPSGYVHNMLGMIFDRSEQHQKAINSFEKALIVDPNNAKILANMGQAMNSIGRFDNALEVLEKAISIEPDYAPTYNNYGSVLREIGDMNGALVAFKKSIKLDPSLSQPHSNIGNVYKELGDPETARKHYEIALEIQPHFPEMLRNLGSITKPKTEDDPFLADLRIAEKIHKDSPKGTMQIHFALAKAHDDLKQFDQAFGYFKSANDLGFSLSKYNAETKAALFSKIKTYFDGPLPELGDLEPLTSKPIFVLGMPRSGTSLVEQILASHKNVYGGGELGYMTHSVMPLVRELEDGEPFDKDRFKSVRKIYNSKIHRESVLPFFTDKLPMNFRWIGFILHAMPEAKIIHTKRDAMAVCWSIYRSCFPAVGLNYQFTFESIAAYYNHYTDLMAFWEERFPGRIYTQNYEQLTENQERETRALVKMCDLEWDDNCLNFHLTKRAVRTASAGQVQAGMYKSSSEAWRNYETQLEPLRQLLAE